MKFKKFAAVILMSVMIGSMSLKFAAVILMSVMIGSMSLSGCGINKNATAVTMTGDAIDTIEVDMGYANFAARVQQASYDSIFASYYGEDY